MQGWQSQTHANGFVRSDPLDMRRHFPAGFPIHFVIRFKPDGIAVGSCFSCLQPGKTATNRYAVWFEPDYEMNWKSGWKMPTHIQWIGSDEAVTMSLTLPTLHQKTEDSWTDKLVTALVPLPLHVELNKSIYGPWNLFSFALALLCAAIGATMSRRYNFATSAVIGWVLFIFLLGIAGLLTFFCVQEWPAREALSRL